MSLVETIESGTTIFSSEAFLFNDPPLKYMGWQYMIAEVGKFEDIFNKLVWCEGFWGGGDRSVYHVFPKKHRLVISGNLFRTFWTVSSWIFSFG